MICGLGQQTLLPSWPELDALVVSLGPFYTCAWCALERSTTVSAPASADPAVTQQLLVFLRSAGVIAPQETNNGPIKRSLYEPVSWTYQKDWPLPGNLDATLSLTLAAWRPVLTPQEKLWVWRQLAEREAAAYLASLLRKHRIGSHLANEILSHQEDEWNRLSLGRKRYVIWASVRGAASQYLSSGGSEDAALAALACEIRRRSRWLCQKEDMGALHGSDFCFLPEKAWRRPLMVEVALSSILRIGDDYWLARPSPAHV